MKTSTPSETNGREKVQGVEAHVKPSSEMRFIPYYPKTILGIYDKHEMFVITNPKTDLPGSSALWTTNDSLISLAEDHFGCLWSSAVKTIC